MVSLARLQRQMQVLHRFLPCDVGCTRTDAQRQSGASEIDWTAAPGAVFPLLNRSLIQAEVGATATEAALDAQDGRSFARRGAITLARRSREGRDGGAVAGRQTGSRGSIGWSRCWC